MASAVSTPGGGGSESFQAAENQEANADAQSTMSVTNGPSSPDSTESAKNEKKPEDTVKKFDNVNYVEAPIPKTNPWTKAKNVTEPGMIFEFLVSSLDTRQQSNR